MGINIISATSLALLIANVPSIKDDRRDGLTLESRSDSRARTGDPIQTNLTGELALLESDDK